MAGDEDEDDLLEDDEDEDEEEVDADGAGLVVAPGGGNARRRAAASDDDDDSEDEEDDDDDDLEVAQEWRGLSTLPEREAVLDALAPLAEQGRQGVTVLLLGKGGSGKSSLVNAILGEKAAAVSAFKLQPDVEASVTYAREVRLPAAHRHASLLNGFRLRLVDTAGLEDPEAGDALNYGALQRVAQDLQGRPVDAVLYVDRLDLYRVERLDRRALSALTDQFGKGLWKRAALALTHGGLPAPPPGTTFESFSERRAALLRQAVRAASGPFFARAASSSMPVALAECSEACATDARTGYRVLPDGTAWLPALLSDVAALALAPGKPYTWRPSLARRANGGALGRWVMVPLVFAAQAALFSLVLRPRLEERREAQERRVEGRWKARTRQRRRVGVGAPNRPSAADAARLKRMGLAGA
jgi:hypothetical protein